MQKKEFGGLILWPVLFDHAHRKGKGNGVYADNSEVVAISIPNCYCNYYSSFIIWSNIFMYTIVGYVPRED